MESKTEVSFQYRLSKEGQLVRLSIDGGNVKADQAHKLAVGIVVEKVTALARKRGVLPEGEDEEYVMDLVQSRINFSPEGEPYVALQNLQTSTENSSGFEGRMVCSEASPLDTIVHLLVGHLGCMIQRGVIEEEIAAWVKQYGSPHLKDLQARNLNLRGLYREERRRSELTDAWHWLQDLKGSAQTALSPTEDELAIEARAKVFIPSAEIASWKMPDGKRHTVALAFYLGKKIVYGPTLPAKVV